MKKNILLIVSCLFLTGCIFLEEEEEFIDEYELEDEEDGFEELTQSDGRTIVCNGFTGGKSVEYEFVYNDNDEIEEFSSRQSVNYSSMGESYYYSAKEDLLNYVIKYSTYNGVYIATEVDDMNFVIHIDYIFDLEKITIDKINEFEELTDTEFYAEYLSYSSNSIYATYEAIGYSCKR